MSRCILLLLVLSTLALAACSRAAPSTPHNTFVQSLSFEQLASIFRGEATRWSQIDPSYPDEPIAVYSPGVDSDTELVRGIEGNLNAIGYFGYAYYQAEVDLLRAVLIDGGSGPVAPGEHAVSDGSCPLARPLFIYTGEQTLEQNPAVAAFVSYYLQSVGDVVAEVGYFPMPDAALAAAQQELVAALR